ncbi:MAG: hypothetical protein WD872_21000 [Pirellulaceae bacterium]
MAASQPYVGQWNRLVSTTNWQKGQIIAQWRESLIAQELPVTEYSDDAWGRLVGGVTGQHAGRLRRVFQRFGGEYQQYNGLFWSHFQAALDWTDAEMWLEGAVGSGWSVARMREQRWETLGKLDGDRPQAADVVASETDEDFEPAQKQSPVPHSITGEYDDVQAGPRHEGSDFGDQMATSLPDRQAAASWEEPTGTPVELVRPFENLPELPDDLADAFDAMKLALLHHKADGWAQVPLADAVHALDALKALASAPSSDKAPF